jgi:hypothetical protein
MDSLLKEFILQELSQFSRIRQMMMGLVPSITSIGIMTAENPEGRVAPKSFNKQQNRSLMQDLRKMGYGPISIGGSFGVPENSFLIPNISRQQIIDLGIANNQAAVIWGQKQEQGGKPFVQWEYIEGSKTKQIKNTSKSGMDIQQRDDYYSEKRGRKFIIPFFE